jgi:prepilin-type processing-associated H-X9-DG protein
LNFTSRHGTTVNFAFADGSVRFIDPGIDPEIFQRIATIDSGVPATLTDPDGVNTSVYALTDTSNLLRFQFVEAATEGVTVEARAAGNPVAVPIRFSYLGKTPAGGTLTASFDINPSPNTFVTLEAPATAAVGNAIYRFVRWQSPLGATTATSLTFLVDSATTVTAVYEQLADVSVTLQAVNLATGAAVPAVFNISQPPLGSVAAPFTLARKPFEPFTVTAPLQVGTCTFRNWFDPATGFASLASRTLNGNVTSNQVRVARYSCR